MPLLSRWMIKLSMVYLLVGLTLAGLLLVQPVFDWPSGWQALRPVYLHYLFIGWVTQLIMGVGYWMLPRYSSEHPRGNETLGWTIFVTLNLGLVLRGIGEPAVILMPAARLGWLLAVASICLLVAGLGFILNTWGRIKAF